MPRPRIDHQTKTDADAPSTGPDLAPEVAPEATIQADIEAPDAEVAPVAAGSVNDAGKVPAEGEGDSGDLTLDGESAHDAAVASWRRNNPEPADVEE